MKTNAIIIAVAALALASCSRDAIEPSIVENTNAISFSAYTNTTVTKGVAIANDELTGDTGGIGVFAFYQPAVAGVSVNFNTRKFATPDFMYNQRVYNDGTNWVYSPIKYWPNNTGDLLSFFAYAPYDANKTWDDLGIATDATASKITASFPIYNEKAAMKDILWTDPQLNKTKASTAAGNDNPIIFDFKHILSKVAIEAGVETDKAAGTPSAWTYAKTKITINSIEFKGLAESYNFSKTIASSPVTTWSATGSQDVKLTESDFQNYEINSTNWTTAEYKTLLAQENSNPAFLFLAPQAFTSDAKDLVITYTVLTKENWNSSTLGANDSKIVNTIECSLADILPDSKFETGKAYTLKFLIGMNSVKVSADVDAWENANTNGYQINTPANNGN